MVPLTTRRCSRRADAGKNRCYNPATDHAKLLKRLVVRFTYTVRPFQFCLFLLQHWICYTS